ncbi:hypothetical protein Ga0100230_016240 [Opitutaceae bacterium TAV3]|nr:hypothetical protein Ga0100230_016240 [Opitutaceae bacterium TAV3]
MSTPFNLTRRKLLILAWVMIAGAVLVAAGVTAYYQIENAAGRRVWAGVKQLAASRGEPLSLAQTLPASVQPTENFGATLVFASSFGRQAGGTLDKINGRRPDADAAKWRMTAPPPPPPPPICEMSEPGFGLWWQGEAVPLDEWRAYLGTHDVLGFLNTHATDMAEIASASRLPYARFNVDYEHSVLAGMPYLPAMRSLSRLFALRAAAQIEKGDGTAALADVITVFRLVHALRDEPFILTHLAANANATVGLQVMREGLARGVWSDAELTTLATELAQLNLLGNAMRGLRAELAFSTELMERLGNDPEATLARMTNGGGYDARFVHYVPGGWVYRNMALSARIFLDGVFPSYDAVARRVNLHQLAQVDQMVRGMEPGPYTILARMFMPGFYRAITNCAATQTQIEMAQVACGLEVYRRAHGRYPKSLDNIAGFPGVRTLHDLVTGEAPRYQQRADGRAFVLYTTGADRIDNGGVVALTEEGSLNPHKGDWVWPAPMTVEGTKKLNAQRRALELQRWALATAAR